MELKKTTKFTLPTVKKEIESKKEDRQESLCMEVAECVAELMNAATSFHQLHLKVTGQGSFASHKALNEIYDAMPGLADDLAESFQGAKGELLTYSTSSPRSLSSVKEAISYLKELKEMVTELQGKMPYSEIVNDLDVAKSSINGTLYKLMFLS